MSDASTTVSHTTSALHTVLDTLNSGLGYSIGGLILVVGAGYWGWKKLNSPRVIIKFMRWRNAKDMKKMGVENHETMVDLNRLLDSVEAYATKQKMSGSAMTKMLRPLQDSANNGARFYQSMAHIANTIGDTGLSDNLRKKGKQVKSNSPLMAGLLKRAKI